MAEVRFYIGAYHAIRRISANMDVLVALGTNAAYFYSVYIVVKALTSEIFEGQDFFETSAMLVSFIILGKYLEVMAKGKTSDALAKLMALTPETAVLVCVDIEGMKTKLVIWNKVTCISTEKSKFHVTAGMKKSRSRDAYERFFGMELRLEFINDPVVSFYCAYIRFLGVYYFYKDSVGFLCWSSNLEASLIKNV